MAFGSSILARLGLDTAGFKSALQSAQSDLTGFGKHVAGIAGVGLSIAGIEHAIASVVEYGSHIQDLSDRYGVNAESLQRLGNAAELHGSSLEGVAKGFRFLEVNQSKALAGSEKQIKAFANLGVTIENLRKLSPEEIMLKLGQSSLNAADTVAILGKSALELRPTLAGLADGTIEYGKAIDAIDIQRLKDADDTWKKLWQDIRVGGAEFLTLEMTNWKGLITDAGAGAVTLWDTIKNAGVTAWQEIFASREELAKLDEEDTKKMLAALDAVKEKAEKAKRKFTPEGDGEKAKSKSELAAEQKERERLQFTLKELADRPETFSNDQTIQAWDAGRRARQVQQLEADAKKQAVEDPEGARRTLDRADQIRQGLGSSGLKESEQTAAVRAGIDSSKMATDIASMKNNLDFADIDL